MQSYDCIVIGVGAVGSATLARLAASGARVLGLERFEPGHDRGSSHGRTRMIRLAYTEHPDYVPLLRRTFELWSELERRTGESLYSQTGILEAGPPGSELVEGVLRSSAEHEIPVEELSHAECSRRFPGMQLAPTWRAVFEPVGGYLRVEQCVRALAREAVASGAELRTNTVARGWSVEEGGFVVRSDQETWRASSLVLTQGSWAGPLLSTLGIELRVLRKPQLWFRTRAEHYTSSKGFVPFVVEMESGRLFYGFPELDERGVKVSEHSSGQPVLDPLELDRNLMAEDLRPVQGFIGACLPGVTEECLAHEVCMYTKSPDEHFIVDRHPAHERLAFAAGLSGHGFKFAPVLGQALADLVLEGGTDLPIEFLSASRFTSRGEVPGSS